MESEIRLAEDCVWGISTPAETEACYMSVDIRDIKFNQPRVQTGNFSFEFPFVKFDTAVITGCSFPFVTECLFSNNK